MRFLREASPAKLKWLEKDWRSWCRDKQLPPEGHWSKWLVIAGRGFGKALALDTPVPTPDGWATMGTLEVGDQVFDELGNPCEVTFVSHVQVDRPCYEVEFSDGSKIVADGQHQWLTWTKTARKAAGRRTGNISGRALPPQCRPRSFPGIVTTEEIAATLWAGREHNHSVEVAGALQLPHRDLLVPPYVLGAWLGDGSSRGAEITLSEADSEIIEHISAAGYQAKKQAGSPGKTPRFSIGKQDEQGRSSPSCLRSQLRELGVFGAKHVPEDYLRASEEQRLALLQGLMDTDGSVSRGGHCEFTTTSVPLAGGVFELIVSLGFKPVLTTGRARLNGKDCGEKYRITFTPHCPVFRLARKLQRQHGGKAQARRVGRRYIVGVRPVPSVPVCCIQVSSQSHLFLAGRTMVPTHNTRTASEWVRSLIIEEGLERVNIVGATADDARDTLVEGESGLLAVCRDHERPKYVKAERKLVWPTGATTLVLTAEEPERARGKQHQALACDELGSWRYPDTWTQLMLGLRLPPWPRVLVTTTPRPTPLMKKLLKDKKAVIVRGTTYENRENLATEFYEEVITEYEGTRLGRQELLAELLTDNPNALWQVDLLEKYRVSRVPQLQRVIVAVDPQVGLEKSETGIIVAGIDRAGEVYVLEDATTEGTPEHWSSRVVAAAKAHEVDSIVYEANQGGEMVRAILAQALRGYAGIPPPLRPVRASRGKATRAEPVAHLYEQGKVHHLGVFARLEDQLCEWEPGQRDSPDRMDALVWAVTSLGVGKQEVIALTG